MTLMLLILLLRCITTPLLYISHCSSSCEDIHFFIRKLNNTSAAGVDDITSLMLKGTAYTVSPILSDIFNLSLSLYLMPGSYLEFFLFLSLVILTLPPIIHPSLFNPSVENLLKRSSMALSSNISNSNNILTDRQFGF